MKKRVLCLLLACVACLSLTLSNALASEDTSADCYIATIGTDSYELFEYPEYMSDGEDFIAPTSAEEYSIQNVKVPTSIELDLRQAREV